MRKVPTQCRNARMESSPDLSKFLRESRPKKCKQRWRTEC
ncbi:hypothetical protein AZE42_13575 [Rhizopogon vesiculosus]|uniref:Uncharacterized protein n=1 Tax=Rhizopogon vesiculosus TaxID=180088 RepID=A0A1J8R5J2_9AGAM|nr:hypothetical protein AZE42_13575 [Rhizopogon vesiculosus]